MILWVFSALTLASVLLAALFSDIRRATLALWIAGLSTGAIFLTVGAEVIAVIQWIVATLVALSLTFFSMMFGEYGADRSNSNKKAWVAKALGLISGLTFVAIVWVAGKGLPEGVSAVGLPGNDLMAVGKTMTESHLLSLEVLALTFFLVLVGGGVVARPETGREES